MVTKKRKDPFAQPLPDYVTFINQLYDTCNTNAVLWGIDPAALAAFLLVLTDFNTAWTKSKTKSTASQKDRTTTKQTRNVTNKLARKFAQKWIFLNPLMKDADIISCGLEPRDAVKTAPVKPDTEPDMFLKPMTSHNIKGFFRQPEDSPGVRKRGKPAGVKSVKIAYFVGANPPAEPDDYGKFISITTTSTLIPFLASLKGQPVTIAACWVNSRLVQGDWCEPQTMVIP